MACAMLKDVGEGLCVELGQRLRTMRKQRKLTQKDMFGLDRSYISDIEGGRKMPSLQVLKVLSLGFGVPLASLVEGL